MSCAMACEIMYTPPQTPSRSAAPAWCSQRTLRFFSQLPKMSVAINTTSSDATAAPATVSSPSFLPLFASISASVVSLIPKSDAGGAGGAVITSHSVAAASIQLTLDASATTASASASASPLFVAFASFPVRLQLQSFSMSVSLSSPSSSLVNGALGSTCMPRHDHQC